MLGLDALASAAYGPEALLTVLLPLAIAGVQYMSALALVIVVLLALVAVSYRQTIEAYPNGGGAYAVAKENLGTAAALFAAAAPALDYLSRMLSRAAAGIAPGRAGPRPRLWRQCS